MHKPTDIALKLLGAPFETLDPMAQKVALHVALRRPIAEARPRAQEDAPSLGQKAADRVATLGGSWAFVGLFSLAMVIWVGLNAALLLRLGSTFDPYPYILLNLFLSMLAAIQAPIILMSQNRHADKDRARAEHDYEVNLKAELEIMLLHEKLDTLCDTQWTELIHLQHEQLDWMKAQSSPWPMQSR